MASRRAAPSAALRARLALRGRFRSSAPLRAPALACVCRSPPPPPLLPYSAPRLPPTRHPATRPSAPPRVRAQNGKVVGSYTVRRPGVLMLCWDNTYSVLTNKQLTYRVGKETLPI